MDILDMEYVLATARSIYNFYPTLDAAKADLPRALASGSEPYQPMTYADYRTANRVFWLDAEPVQITREQWTYAFEVLPPMRWESRPGFDSFLMSEFMSIPYTHQYVVRGDGDKATYWQRMVDATDRSTWMQP